MGQGKRPPQIYYSEVVVFIGMVIIAILLILELF
jgi:hypothetical protein